MSFETKCKEHWKQLGLSNPEKLRELIVEIFNRHTNQHEIVVAIYKLVLPEWDQIQSLKGHPEAGRELSIFICSRFQEFDRKYHPDWMPGGAWLNWGFSSNPDLDLWEISFGNCTPVY